MQKNCDLYKYLIIKANNMPFKKNKNKQTMQNINLIHSFNYKTLFNHEHSLASQRPALFVHAQSGLISNDIALRSLSPSSKNSVSDFTCTWQEIKLSERMECDSSNLQNLSATAQKVLLSSLSYFEHIRTNPDLVAAFNKIRVSDLFSSIENCFGKDALENISNGLDENEILNRIFYYAKKRLLSPEVLEEDDIIKIYELLFKTELAPYAELESNIYHPVSVFKALMECVSHLRSGKKARVSTGKSDTTFAGLNGSYFLLNEEGKKLFVFKPMAEEKEVAEGIKCGEGVRREHLASVLNENQTFPIPFTCFVNLQGQIGSLQTFMEGCRGLADIGFDGKLKEYIPCLPKRDLQASLVFDVLYGNVDRHLGNILCAMEGEGNVCLPKKSYMIDQGLCLSSSSSDPLKIEQLVLPQLSETWDLSFINEILNLDILKIQKTLEQHGISQEAISRTLRTAALIKKVLRFALSTPTAKSTITAYDLGLIIRSNQYKLWSDKETEPLVKFLDHVVDVKKKILEENPSRGKIQVLRKKFVNEHPDFDEAMVSSLFGASSQDDSAQRIDWSESIIGKMLA